LNQIAINLPVTIIFGATPNLGRSDQSFTVFTWNLEIKSVLLGLNENIQTKFCFPSPFLYGLAGWLIGTNDPSAGGCSKKTHGYPTDVYAPRSEPEVKGRRAKDGVLIRFISMTFEKKMQLIVIAGCEKNSVLSAQIR